MLNAGVNVGDIHPIGEKPKLGRKNSGAREETSTEPKKPKGRPRKKPVEVKSTEPKRPRGRPRKNTIEESVDNLDGSRNAVEALAIEYPEESVELHSTDCILENTQGNAVLEDGKKRRRYRHAESECDPALESSVQRRKLNNMESAGSNNNDTCPPLLNQNEDKERPVSDHPTHPNYQTSHNVQSNGYSKIGSTRCKVPNDVALPRIVFCLAHHGKVAWDVKWRPPSEHDSKCKHRMGYLAVLSGNGSLEV